MKVSPRRRPDNRHNRDKCLCPVAPSFMRDVSLYIQSAPFRPSSAHIKHPHFLGLHSHPSSESLIMATALAPYKITVTICSPAPLGH